MKAIELFGYIFNFLIVALIFIILLAITFKMSLKKYAVRTDKISFYGLFLGMDNRSILAFSCITLNYIFLIWCTASFTGLNILYVVITTLLIVLYDIMIKEYKNIPMDLIYVAINCLCLFVTSLIYKYLTTEYTTIFLLIILGLVIIFVFLYFTYITFKFLNNIVLHQEHVKRKKYKKV